MAEINSGLRTITEIANVAGVDLEEVATTEYESSGKHVDFRRITVGGLPISGFDQEVNVPSAADSLEIKVDGDVVATLDVVE